jgi:hypothetical protein
VAGEEEEGEAGEGEEEGYCLPLDALEPEAGPEAGAGEKEGEGDEE